MNIKFEEYYKSIYGERWPVLRQSLIHCENKKVSIFSKNDNHTGNTFLEEGGLLVSEQLGMGSYELDLASVYSILALKPEKDCSYLDLCSAPGGKALTAQYLTEGSGEWVLNELSQARLNRLKAVMRDYSPANDIVFKKRNAEKWGLAEQEVYDYVICDVPCSGEGHLLNNQSELEKWTPKRSKGIQIRQHAILCAALEAVKTGGRILYSTCTVNPQENDGVIEKLLKKRGDRVEVCRVENPMGGEETKYGFNLFPDKLGIGPIYFSILKKLN